MPDNSDSNISDAIHKLRQFYVAVSFTTYRTTDLVKFRDQVIAALYAYEDGARRERTPILGAAIL